MKTQKIRIFFIFLIMLGISQTMLIAQISKAFAYVKAYEDYVIPNSSTGYIELTTIGADGGYVEFKNLISNFKVGGGGGAYLKAYFKIGTGSNQLKPESTSFSK